MPTESQLHANRQNAQSSTGPRTDPGKSASSQNHLTHGLYTRHDYVKPEERDFYRDFCDNMRRELAPVGFIEETLAAVVIGASWRLRRCDEADGSLADYKAEDPLLDETTEKTRRSIERARDSAHSQFHRSFNQLRKLQAERKRAESPAATPPAPDPDFDLDAAIDAQLAAIMASPQPDWAAIGLDDETYFKTQLGSNCSPAKPVPTASPNPMR